MDDTFYKSYTIFSGCHWEKKQFTALFKTVYNTGVTNNYGKYSTYTIVSLKSSQKRLKCYKIKYL